MNIVFTKTSDVKHTVAVTRSNGSSDRVELNSRSFLRHDLAHFAVESEIPIKRGFWGCVAAGASLNGDGVDGAEIWLAESLAGSVQTLMRVNGEIERYLEVLERLCPDLADNKLAARIHERVRQLRGQWKATPYRRDMRLIWPE